VIGIQISVATLGIKHLVNILIIQYDPIFSTNLYQEKATLTLNSKTEGKIGMPNNYLQPQAPSFIFSYNSSLRRGDSKS
jgi:hypothetical protein